MSGCDATHHLLTTKKLHRPVILWGLIDENVWPVKLDLPRILVDRLRLMRDEIGHAVVDLWMHSATSGLLSVRLTPHTRTHRRPLDVMIFSIGFGGATTSIQALDEIVFETSDVAGAWLCIAKVLSLLDTLREISLVPRGVRLPVEVATALDTALEVLDRNQNERSTLKIQVQISSGRTPTFTLYRGTEADQWQLLVRIHMTNSDAEPGVLANGSDHSVPISLATSATDGWAIISYIAFAYEKAPIDDICFFLGDFQSGNHESLPIEEEDAEPVVIERRVVPVNELRSQQ